MSKIRKQNAFTLIELIVVLVITSITLIAVLELYQKCILFTTQLRQRTAQTTELNYCLDKMITEITDALSSKAKLELIKADGVNILSGVKLTEYDSEDESKVYRQLEWVIASDENEAYSIYRKDFVLLDENSTELYYPVCDRIASFDIEIVNSDGLEDPNATAALMQFNVKSYINDVEGKTFSASRTFCLRRNEILGVPDMDAIQNQIDTIIESKRRTFRVLK